AAQTASLARPERLAILRGAMTIRTSPVVFATLFFALTACDSQRPAPPAPPAAVGTHTPPAASGSPALMSPEPKSTSGDFEGELLVTVQRKGEKEPQRFDARFKGPRARF